MIPWKCLLTLINLRDEYDFLRVYLSLFCILLCFSYLRWLSMFLTLCISVFFLLFFSFAT